MNAQQILDRALASPISLYGSQSKLETLRFRLYNERKRDRALARQIHGPLAASRYDTLSMKLTFDLETRKWKLEIVKEDNLLQDIEVRE